MIRRALWQGLLAGAAVLGVLRSVMAQAGLRGPVSSAKLAVVRLTNDQILENAAGVGAPPSTWPRKELAVDLLHKTVYAFATGAVADALAARNGPGPGQRHAARGAGSAHRCRTAAAGRVSRMPRPGPADRVEERR
jgi:hypothetical protein